MDAKIIDGSLVLTLQLENPRPSSSGKTLIVAGTNGFLKNVVLHPGTNKPISVSVNATIPKD